MCVIIYIIFDNMSFYHSNCFCCLIWNLCFYLLSNFFQYIVDGPDEDVLDYGTVGARENRTITFKIINKNPVEV